MNQLSCCQDCGNKCGQNWPKECDEAQQELKEQEEQENTKGAKP